MSFCSTSLCYNIDEKKNGFLGTVWSLHVCMGFLPALSFLSHPRDVVHWHLHCPSLSECRPGIGWPSDERASCPGWGPPLHPELLGEALATWGPDWNISILLVFMNLSLCRAHIYLCLILEMLCIFIWKFGDFLWPEICHRNFTSCFYQLASLKLVLLSHLAWNQFLRTYLWHWRLLVYQIKAFRKWKVWFIILNFRS